MSYNPGVSFFIAFDDLDPSKGGQCIFFTQKRRRCTWVCENDDNQRAIELRKTIQALPANAVSLQLLQEYVQSNCCRSGNARHRDRIEDIDLLLPLAQRWLQEIQRVAIHQTIPSQSQSLPQTSVHSTLCVAACDDKATVRNPAASKSVANSNAQPPELLDSVPASISSQHPDGEHRYNLRRAKATATEPVPQRTLSEFRRHIVDPAATDGVASKMLEKLVDRDFETGALYVFNRTSSLGHVKIGWTTKSVSSRLEDWSRCGYTPILLFSVESVPFAQRVETLIHNELIKEWRRERRCKGCSKSHQEWFEVTEERAKQTINDWAVFIKKARPYGKDGKLKEIWVKIIKAMQKRNELFTAQTMLKIYERLLELVATKNSVGIEAALVSKHSKKTEEDMEKIPTIKIEKSEETVIKIESIPENDHNSGEEQSREGQTSVEHPLPARNIIKHEKRSSQSTDEACTVMVKLESPVADQLSPSEIPFPTQSSETNILTGVKVRPDFKQEINTKTVPIDIPIHDIAGADITIATRPQLYASGTNA